MFIVLEYHIEDLIKSLRKLISGTELYGSRPSMSISVCSDRQVQLALQVQSFLLNLGLV